MHFLLTHIVTDNIDLSQESEGFTTLFSYFSSSRQEKKSTSKLRAIKMRKTIAENLEPRAASPFYKGIEEECLLLLL